MYLDNGYIIEVDPDTDIVDNIEMLKERAYRDGMPRELHVESMMKKFAKPRRSTRKLKN